MRLKGAGALGCFLLLLLAAGCGVQGEPLPPLLNVPQPPEILGMQRGNRVLIRWAMPRLTTEGQAVRPGKLGGAEILRVLLPGLRATVTRSEFEAGARVVGTVAAAELGKPLIEFSGELPAGAAGQTAAYAVRLSNQHGQAAGLSNIITIPVLVAPPAPAGLAAKATEHAVALEWPAAAGAALYDVYRSEESGSLELKAQVPAQPGRLAYSDEEFVNGRNYRYVVRAVAVQGQFRGESEDSPAASIRPEDVFPPRVPTGLVAVPVNGGVELSWEPNSESDLAGYTLFRNEEGGAAKRLNRELLVSPAFRDTTARPGVSYRYAVSAVDRSGNESARSEPATARIP